MINNGLEKFHRFENKTNCNTLRVPFLENHDMDQDIVAPTTTSNIISASIVHRHGARGPGGNSINPFKNEILIMSIFFFHFLLKEINEFE